MKPVGKLLVFRRQNAKRVSALICLVLFVALQVFASSTALHRAIHNDADLPTHHCAITVISQGEATVATTASLLLTIAVAFWFFLAPFHSAIISSFDRRLALGRAPPQN